MRASQSRLILEVAAGRALHRLGRAALVKRLQEIVAGVQARGERTPGYAVGNLLNLLLHLGANLRGTDFSRLCVWQASLERALLPEVNFAQSDLSGSSFSHPLQFIRAVQFGAEGELQIAIFAAGRLHIWRIVEGQLRVELAFGINTATAIFSPDHRLLVSWHADGHVRIWNVSSGELLATADDDVVVRRWRIAPAALQLEGLAPKEMPAAVELSAELRGHSNAIEMVRFSPDGRRLYSASKDETIREWDVATGACLRILRSERPYAGLDITGATGLSEGQRASLRALGAVEAA